MMVLNEALDRYSRGKPELTQEMSETAFALLHSGGELSGKHRNSWDFLENDGIGEKKGWRQKSFVEFMSYIKEIFQLEGVVLDAFDWKAAGNTTLVDVSRTLFLIRTGSSFLYYPTRSIGYLQLTHYRSVAQQVQMPLC